MTKCGALCMLRKYYTPEHNTLPSEIVWICFTYIMRNGLFSNMNTVLKIMFPPKFMRWNLVVYMIILKYSGIRKQDWGLYKRGSSQDWSFSPSVCYPRRMEQRDTTLEIKSSCLLTPALAPWPWTSHSPELWRNAFLFFFLLINYSTQSQAFCYSNESSAVCLAELYLLKRFFSWEITMRCLL